MHAKGLSAKRIKGAENMDKKIKVLFICTHNSARSQMAEGILKNMYPEKYEALSAGTIASNVNPYAIKVMNEIGIDISHQRSKKVEEFHGRFFDYVVTVCNNAKETCPFFPGKIHIHKSFEDPANASGTNEEKLVTFRRVRNEISDWIEETFGRKANEREGEDELWLKD